MSVRERIRVAVLALWLAAASQAGAGPRWSIEGGLLDGRLTTEDFNERVESKARLSGFAGVAAEWRAQGRSSYVLGLRYEEMPDDLTVGTGFQVFNGGVPYEMFGRYRLRSQVISFSPRVRFRLRPHFTLGAGPEMRWLLRASSRISTEFRPAGGSPSRHARPAAQIFEDLSKPFDVTGDYERLGLAVTGGAGFTWPLHAHEVRMDAGWLEGITDVVKSSSISRRPRAARLSFGLAW